MYITKKNRHFFQIKNHLSKLLYIVKPVYKGHSRETENVSFIYRLKYMHYSLMGKIILSFIDSDLLYRGAL